MKLVLRVAVLVVLIAAVVVAKERVRAGRIAPSPAARTSGAPQADDLARANRIVAPAAKSDAEQDPNLLPGSKFVDSLKNGKPTMADFGAGWCEACKKMEPVLHESAKRFKGKANVLFVNTDDYPGIAKGYGISVIPTQIYFDSKGTEAARHMGYMPIEEVAAKLKTLGVK
ncbi:MAG: thioredoxin family protein [Armatimonadota bacterium]|jgi:thioredoxin 1